MNLDNAIKIFKEYTNNYISYEACAKKIDHTIRVMNICEKIATSLKLSEEEITLAKLCGLLHDIGRFEQWKKYETFSDKDSIDHGDLGVKVLTSESNSLLRKFISTNKYDSIILNSIKYHNKYQISQELTDKEKLFTNIVRDADKIDILYLYTISGIKIDTNNEKMSVQIYNYLINEKEINKKDLKTKADKLAVSLGFIFDINYIESISILKNEDYYNKQIDLYISTTNNKEFIIQLEQIKNIINKYIGKKTGDKI